MNGKIYQRILAIILCIALVFTSVNLTNLIKNKFNADEIPTEEQQNENISTTLDEEAPIGYHYYNGVLYGNMFIIKYNPNNGTTKYEKENKKYDYPNDIFTRHFYDHVDIYDGIPVYDGTNPDVIEGEKDYTFYIDDRKLANNVFDRDNYNFLNWNTKPDGSGMSFENNQSINNEYSENLHEQVLYAQWELAQTSVSIIKNGGIFPINDFESINNLEKKSTIGQTTTYLLENGKYIYLQETDSTITLTANCLTTIKMPKMTSKDPAVKFVGYETISQNYNQSSNEFFFENKNSKPSLKALFLSELELKGTIDLKGFNGKGSIFLSWGTTSNDDIDKVYKIAQSTDGKNFEYIPDNNLSELIEGKRYGYSGTVQTFTAPVTGKYFIEAYGANGGIGFNINAGDANRAGYGGYSSGYINLEKGQTIYLYVGESGGAYNTSRTYGGGGASAIRTKIWSNGLANNWREHAGGRGGGATYVSLTDTPLSSYIPENYESISKSELLKLEQTAMEKASKHILLVAAGGSGSGDKGTAANGGGLIGEGTTVSNYHYGSTNTWTTTGATQTSAGYGDYGTLNGMPDDYYYRTTNYGTFFYGSNGMSCSGAAGGGWFGGGMCYVTGGGGASSYLGTSIGLYDAKTIAGGNSVNSSSSTYKYQVNGSIIIKCCEYWITTNTAENVYSPDTKAPTDIANIDVTLDNNKKGTITWNESTDEGNDYWYRVDAFEASNHDNKISETQISKFNVTTGLKGYLYVIDNNADTVAHVGNSTLITETSLNNIDVLDIGEEKYIHIAAVDNAGNVSNTKTVLLNKTTIIIDPNEKGTYNNSYKQQSIILSPNEIYNIKEIIPDKDQIFLRWKKTTGDGLLDTSKNTVKAGYSKTTIVAEYVSNLLLQSTPNYTDNTGKGAINLSWEQNDSLSKKYKLYQSLDGANWYETTKLSNNSGINTKSYSYNASTSYYTYTVPYTGTYTLTVRGSVGGNYSTYTGGAGSSITGEFELKRGDVLYIYCGGIGSNGGASGTYGSGGGATDIRLNGTALSNRILVAGGGGGANQDKNGAIESASSANNGTLGNGTTGSAGGGGGYYGGNKGDYTPKTQYLSDYISNKNGTYNIGGFSNYANNSNGYCYSTTYGTPIKPGYVTYDGFSWKVSEYKSKEDADTILFMSSNYGSGNNCTVGVFFYKGYGFCNTCQGVGLSHPSCNDHWDGYRTVYVTTQSTAGTSWIDLNKGIKVGSVSYGSNNTTGSATISFNQAAVGELQTTSINGIIANDTAAPNAPYGGNISSISGSTATLTWSKPEDNGTKYYHLAESYDATKSTLLRKSNITQDIIATGVKEYRYYVDTNASGTVTLSNSTVISTNKLNVSTENLSKYYHIAAVDYAGNLGATYTYQPQSYAEVVATVKWIDDNNINNTRPSNLIVYLYRNNETTPVSQKTLTPSSSTENVIFNNLSPLDANGNPYTYSVKISTVTSLDSRFSYTTSINGLTITNTLNCLVKDFKVNINWYDNNNALKTRPDNIILKLMNGNTVASSKTLSSTETEFTFKDIPGDKTYTLKVEKVVSKLNTNEYVTEVKTVDNNFVVNNTLKYNIIIEPNNGTWNNSSNATTYLKFTNETISLPDPVRTGYEFIGWELDIKDGASITNKTLTVGNQNVKLTAQWKKLSLTLTINPNGGIFDTSSDITTYKMDYNSTKVIDIPTREGYKFKQWELSGKGSSMPSLTVKTIFTMGYENATLTATWENKNINVKLEPNGGTVNPTSIVVKYDNSYGTLPTPIKTGYEFMEWTFDPEGTQSVTEDTIVKNAEDHTLYAQYKIKQTDLNGRVVWVDNNNAYGSRPSELTINILSDGEFSQWVEKDKKSGAFTTSTSSDWTFFKENLQEYNINTNKKIVYSVEIDKSTPISINKKYAYETTYSVDSDGTFVITNTLYEATKNISGTIEWIDKSNTYKSRPESVIVELYQDGKKVDEIIVKGTTDSWTYSFEDWTIFKEGNTEYKYTVNVNPNPTKSNNTDDKYETSIKDTTITNKLISNGKKTIEGSIVWEDYNDTHGLRPNEITLTLYRNNVKIDTQIVNKNTTSYSFTNLDKYDKDLNLYTYKVVETFTSKALTWDSTIKQYIEIDAYSIKVNGFNFTNTLIDTTEKPIIPVKPNHVNTLTIKLDFNDSIKWNDVEKTSSEVISFVTLKQMETVINGTKVSYSSNYNGLEYNTLVTESGVVLNNVQSGKYEIVESNDNTFVLENIKLETSNSITITKENGKWYLTIPETNSNQSGTIKLHMNIDIFNGYDNSALRHNLYSLISSKTNKKLIYMYN